MSRKRVEVERYLKKFLEKIVELIRRNPTAVLGRWIIYDPERDEVQLLDSRDSAVKHVYSNLQDRRYIFMTHVPFESEEAFYGFTRLFQKLLNVDISSEIRKASEEKS